MPGRLPVGGPDHPSCRAGRSHSAGGPCCPVGPPQVVGRRPEPHLHRVPPLPPVLHPLVPAAALQGESNLSRRGCGCVRTWTYLLFRHPYGSAFSGPALPVGAGRCTGAEGGRQPPNQRLPTPVADVYGPVCSLDPRRRGPSVAGLRQLNDEQSVKVICAQGLRRPPAGIRRGTAPAIHHEGQVARGNPAAAGLPLPGYAQWVQQFPHDDGVELHPGPRGTLPPDFACFLSRQVPLCLL